MADSTFKPSRYEVQRIKRIAAKCENYARLAQQGWPGEAYLRGVAEGCSDLAFSLARSIGDRAHG